MRPILFALVVAVLPVALHARLVGSTAPGAGFDQVPGGLRWLHLGLLALLALLLFAALRVRTERDGPALAAGLCAGLFPPATDAVAAGDGTAPLVVSACGAAALLLAALAARRSVRLAGGGGPTLAVLLGGAVAAMLFLPSGAAAFGAEALAPRSLPGILPAAFALALLADGASGGGGPGAGVRRATALFVALLLGLSGLLTLSRAGTWEGPGPFWERAVREDPGNPAALGASAGLLASSGDLAGAEARLRSFVEAVEKGGGARLEGTRGRSAGSAGAVRAAEALLAREGADPEVPGAAMRAARSLAPGSGTVRRLLGEARLRAGALGEAILEFEAAVALDREDAAAWDALARGHLEGGLAEAALEDARRATGLRPLEKPFVVTYAKALLAVDRDGQALEALHGALGPPPFDPAVAAAYADAHDRVARKEVSAGLLGRALRRAREGLAKVPGHAGCREVADALQARYDRERPEAEKWLDPKPDGSVDLNLWIYHAAWLCQWGRYEEAAPHFDRMLARFGSRADVRYHYGREFWEARGTLEGYEKAVASYRDALAREPGHAEARNRLWQCLRTLGRTEEAKEQARRFAEIAPAHPDAAEAEQFAAPAGANR